MESKDFKKLIKKGDYQNILERYMRNEIFLTIEQLQKVIDLKRGTSDENHGGVNFKYRAKNNESQKLLSVRTSLNVKCKCGHSVFMPNNIPKCVCSFCYRTVYNKNELGKKQKFKDEFKKKRRQLNGIKNNKTKN